MPRVCAPLVCRTGTGCVVCCSGCVGPGTEPRRATPPPVSLLRPQMLCRPYPLGCMCWYPCCIMCPLLPVLAAAPAAGPLLPTCKPVTAPAESLPTAAAPWVGGLQCHECFCALTYSCCESGVRGALPELGDASAAWSWLCLVWLLGPPARFSGFLWALHTSLPVLACLAPISSSYSGCRGNAPAHAATAWPVPEPHAGLGLTFLPPEPPPAAIPPAGPPATMVSFPRLLDTSVGAASRPAGRWRSNPTP